MFTYIYGTDEAEQLYYIYFVLGVLHSHSFSLYWHSIFVYQGLKSIVYIILSFLPHSFQIFGAIKKRPPRCLCIFGKNT